MLFNTINFWIFFLVVVFLLFINSLLFKSNKIQNYILLISSYFFYGYWDWRFLFLIIIVSLQTFLFGGLIEINKKKSKFYLTISITINLIILGFFKYYNFFVDELYAVFELSKSFSTLNIILPVGISFYIFQSLTYVFDIYKKKMTPEKNMINYFAYVAFFPQLVAGPIERAISLLPQFRKVINFDFDNIYAGIKISIIGMFMKIFIADNLAIYTDEIFTNYINYSGGTLFLGAVYFSVQIYADFCGYSLIAIGTAKIIGFNLMDNFNNPYFATSIQDFWKRWHISLSTFFRDYIYFPLGGSKHNNFNTYKNIIVTFSLSGLWHGANWTFVLWGFINGLLLVIQKKTSGIFNFLKNEIIKKTLGWFLTIFSTLFLWIIFRSESISDSYYYILKIFTDFSFPDKKAGLIILIYFLLVDALLFFFKKEKIWFKNIYIEIFVLSIFSIMFIGNISVNKNFIYFQF